MTRSRSAPARRRPRTTARRLLLLLLATLPWAASLRADPPSDPQVGTADATLPPKQKTPPDDPEAAERVLRRAAAPVGEADWHAAYVRDSSERLSPEAAATLAFARDAAYGRAQAVNDLQTGGERVRPLVRSLDVGRHEILKVLYHRAMALANQRLEQEGLSPLRRVQAVNAGGTGDYTRDQDITVFVDDPLRERYFFEAVEAVARSPDIGLKADVKPTGGIDFPEIEVTFFRGSNDLPDARFATDVEQYALKYQQAIANQAADKEAYKGGGADIEVKGRRVPGQMYVQQLTWEGGKVRYLAETPQSFREGASLFGGTAPERWQRFERAAHIFSDFVQGRQHAEGAHRELTKGPLKYSGRGIDHFCALHGMKPWADLKTEDRVVLLRKVWPHIDPETPAGARVYAQVCDALDVAYHVKSKKEMKPGTDASAAGRADAIALAFLRNATGMTLAKMAQDLLNPPAFDAKTMRAVAGDAWDRMTPVERFRFAIERDKVFRGATGRAAMENLLVAVSMLRTMDFVDGKPVRDRPGEQMLAKALAHAPKELRPVLELASEYAGAWARRQQTSDPRVRAECDAQLADVRKRLVVHCPQVGSRMPGEALLAKAAAAGPRAVLAAESKAGRSWLPDTAREASEAFQEHLRAAFPSLREEWGEFRKMVGENGWDGYAANKLVHELCQWDTVADALTLVEMYQGGAAWNDYGKFLGVNLGSRIHWGVGPLVQAFDVYDADPSAAAKKAKELGKSVVFMTLSRVVPWAASAKIAFDVASGTVRVTVGWAVGKANEATIDALYTGEAGRLAAGAAGTVKGRLRDSGVSVLTDEQMRRVADPVARIETRVVDSDAVYRRFLGAWMKVDPDEVPRPSKGPAETDAFVRAHDAFVRILLRQAEEKGPTWVQEPGRPFFPVVLREQEVEDALKALEPFLREAAGREADRVVSEAAVRGYRSYLDAEGADVIRDGLARRFSCDLLGGLIQHWQVRITSQILAAREIERAGTALDQRAIAERLLESWVPSETRVPPLEMRFQGGKLRPVRRADGSASLVPAGGGDDSAPEVSFRVEATAVGVPVLGGRALDGSKPVHLGLMLVGDGELGDVEKPIRWEITPRKLVKVREEGDGGDDVLRPGDLADDKVLVRAMAAGGAGPELARAEVPVRVLVPEEALRRKVPLYRHESRRGGGGLRERYVYARWDPDLPPDWKSEDGEIFHGDYELFHGDGTTRAGVRRYRYGVLHGKSEQFDSKGRLVHETPYENGLTHGDDVRYDPDSSGRQVFRFERGRPTEERTSHADGKPASQITYEYEDHEPGGMDVTVRGEATTWWSRGGIRWTGRHERRGRIIDVPPFDDQGGSDGQRVHKKVGPWRWFHSNGKPARQCEYRDGKQEGAYRTFDEEGRPLVVGQHANDLEEGRWLTHEYLVHPDGVKHRVLFTVYVRGERKESGIEGE